MDETRNIKKEPHMIKKMISAAAGICFVLALTAPCIGADKPDFEQPLLITSAGQSAEVQLANVLAKRAELNAVLSKMAGEKDLAGIKTIALVLGVSLKGLGAAGLNTAQEKERVSVLLEAAKAASIPVLCMHLGGEARRGQISDELIKFCLPYAATVIVVKSGNKDGLFTTFCKEKGIPLIEVERTVDALAPLKTLFETT